MNTLGITRFEVQLEKVESIITSALQEKDLVHSLYSQDLRTPFFMLQGLARLYRRIHNPKRFEKFVLQSKQIEDLLGEYDFYLVIQTEITGKTAIDKKLKAALTELIATTKQKLNDTLEDKGWLDGKRIRKWRKQLSELTWLEEKNESEAIRNVYQAAVNKVDDFIELLPSPLTDMELQVHELRRKLRWLSIYCHGLYHATVLIPNEKETEIPYKKYFTKAVKTSKFNQFTLSEDNKYPLVLDQQAFWGLSWIIDKIGKLKDEGLHEEAKIHLLEKIELTDNELKKLQLLKEQQEASTKSILSKCFSTIKEFKEYKVLNDLVV